MLCKTFRNKVTAGKLLSKMSISSCVFKKDYSIELSYLCILKSNLTFSLPRNIEINMKNAWTIVDDLSELEIVLTGSFLCYKVHWSSLRQKC